MSETLAEFGFYEEEKSLDAEHGFLEYSIPTITKPTEVAEESSAFGPPNEVFVLSNEQLLLPVEGEEEKLEEGQKRVMQDPRNFMITIMLNGDVQVSDTHGHVSVLSKDVLIRENIDTDNLNDDTIRQLLQMTLAASSDCEKSSQKKQVDCEPENVSPKSLEQSEFDDPAPKAAINVIPSLLSSRRKRRVKEVFDPSDIPKRPSTASLVPASAPRLSLAAPEATNLSSSNNNFKTEPAANNKNDNFRPINGAGMDMFLNLTKTEGVTIYTPKSVWRNERINQGSESARFCCAFCEMPIPKNKVDFVLLRIPAHTQCVKGSTMLSPSGTEENDGGGDGVGGGGSNKNNNNKRRSGGGGGNNAKAIIKI